MHQSLALRVAKRGRLVWAIFEHPAAGLLVFLLLGGVASLSMGIDNNWDLRNYHFYNPWAWLNRRMRMDYAPAQLQSYHTPFLDLPFYAVVKAGMPAVAICFAMGAPFGIAAYFFARIARFVIDDVGISRKNPTLILVGFVALTGAAGVSQIGSTMNEWATTAIVMAALFVLLRATRLDSSLSSRAATISGLLLGLAVGLKLTAAIFAGSVFVSLLAWSWTGRVDVRGIVAFSLAGIAGFLISYGYWGFLLWREFENPFFPYFNNLFRSPYWEPRGLLDRRFRPDTLAHWIIFPFRIARHNTLSTEETMRDTRLAALCLASVALLIRTALQRWSTGRRSTRVSRRRVPASILLLGVFVCVSYVSWLAMFSIYRYTIPMELTVGLLLVLTLRECFDGVPRHDVIVATICLMVVATTVVPNWGRARLHRGRYMDVRMPQMPARSLVMVLNAEPVSYLVPFMDRATTVIRPLSNFTDPSLTNRFEREMAGLIATYDGPMFDLGFSGPAATAEQNALQSYGLRRADKECRPIASSLERQALVMCPLRR